ncbi:MAG: hypothetical protein N2712_03575 [Brevinematales bacterium]|nr:hypothetical protein [Brevinematales bacterium]
MRFLKVFIVLYLVSIVFVSCINITANRISVQIAKGAGNNYYEISVYSNSGLTLENTNTFVFSIQDNKNVLLESATGNLDRGYSSWTSYRNYNRGVYIVVVKIDMTGDKVFSSGEDIFSYKYVVVAEDNSSAVSFSDTDNWIGL